MSAPPEKRKALAGDQGDSKIDNVGTSNDNQEHNPASQIHQANYPRALLPCPVAFARRFGFCFAVYVRERNTETRLGRYGSAGAAIAAAADLNAIFAEVAT